MGSKSSSAAPPDPRLIDAQIRSMGIQDSAIQQILSNSNRMMPLQEEQMQFGLKTARQAYDDSQADRQFALSRRSMLSGAQDQLFRDAQGFNTDARRAELAGQAAGDVTQAFGLARGQQTRAMQAMGVNPDSGRFAAMGNQMTAQQALAQASAMNKVRQAARMEGYMLNDRASNALAGYPAMASGLNTQGAGFGAAGLGLANSGLGGMNSGFGAAGGMAGQMGSNAAGMYNAEANYKNGQDKIAADSNPFNTMLGAAAGVGTSWALGGVPKPSDSRLKKDVVHVGDDARSGLNLYEFAYIGGDGRRFRGVMADEVQAVMPQAVTHDGRGFALVNYEMLGIEMVEV